MRDHGGVYRGAAASAARAARRAPWPVGGRGRRWLPLVATLPALLGVGAAGPSAQSVTVTPTTGTYPGAPRSVQLLDVTLPSGQHLWFDRDLCRTFAWKDTDNTTTLASPVATSTRWPVPDITVYQNYPGLYSGQLGGFWASDWGSPWQPHFQGYTTTATSVTFTCDFPTAFSGASPDRYTAAMTYSDAQRPAGVGYGLQATITPPAGVTGLGTWTQQTGVGAVGGDATGLAAWAFDGDGYGVTEFPWVPGLATRDERSGGIHFWSILTHPQGTFVLEQPNLFDPAAFGDWHLLNNGRDPGFWVSKPTTGTTAGGTVTSDPLVFLWKREPGRSVPQKYLDARYALMRGWLATLQFGPQHNPRPAEGAGGGVVPFAQLASIGNYFNGATGAGDWHQRQVQLIAQVPMLHTTNGQPSGIDQNTDALAADYFLPNASDLPGLDPAYTASPYTYGTLQQFRDGLNLLRLLGLSATYWSQWYYRGNYCPGSTRGVSPELSHFASSWSCSAFFRDHPTWATTAGDGTRYVNYLAPGILDWMKSWTQQYWLGYGMQGRFVDVEAQIPYVYGAEAPLFLDFYVWTLRQGGYLQAEKPQAFLGPLYDNDANPYGRAGREWGMPLATGAVRDRNCLGLPGTTGLTACQAALARLGPYAGTDYDVAAARRVHAIGGALGMTVTGDRLARMHTFGQAYIDAIKGENQHFGNLQDRFGVPDRVELIHPTAQPMPPDTVTLAAALGATDTTLYALPVYQLPQVGRVQIDNEILGYTANDSDSGLNMGLSTLSGLSRGLNGTTPAAHSAGGPLRALDDQQHWTYDDAYWVYGASPNEVWVRYADGTVWQQGGQAPAPLPQITGVQVSATGTSATLTFTTNVPASAWVEYDTYGSAEPYNSQRPADWWPNYLRKTNLGDLGAPPAAATHSRTLTGLTPGATYHYRVVARGPAQAVTADATFVAGTTPPSPTAILPGPTATRTATALLPSPTASAPTPTPTGQPNPTATRTATPAPSGMTVSVAASYVPSGGTIQWSWTGATDPATLFVIHHASNDARGWAWLFTNCGPTQPASVVASGTCSLVDPGLPVDSYVVIALNGSGYLATSAPFQLGGAPPTPAASPTATRTATAPLPSPTASVTTTIVPGTPTPATTASSTPPATGCILGDINCDGIVDIRDYGIWRQTFGQMNCGNPTDLNGDCIVDIRDYGIWRANFGHTAGTAAPTATPVAAPRVGAATPTPIAGSPPVSGKSGSEWGWILALVQALGSILANQIMLSVPGRPQ